MPPIESFPWLSRNITERAPTMKRSRRRLQIPQHEFLFAAETYRLTSETTLDGESTGLHPPKTAVIYWVPFRRGFERTNSVADLVEELTAQRWTLRFIPTRGLAQIRFSPGTENDAPTHCRICCRRRLSTSFHSAPAFGLAW